MINKIAIFASGSGSNAENIVNYFKNSDIVEVSLILTNNSEAFVIERARRLGIPYKVFDKEDFFGSNNILDLLRHTSIDLIVLAGFLWKFPENIISYFPDRVVNIHPALLPKYGGKGMYGNNVHKAVIRNNEKESGITIHYVNENYDDGEILFQAKCTVDEGDSHEDVAKKVHALEYAHFPRVIASLL